MLEWQRVPLPACPSDRTRNEGQERYKPCTPTHRPRRASTSEVGVTLFAYAYVCVYMADTTIRLSEEAKARLDRFKREGESYEDAVVRLTERDRWAGFGALSDTESDTREGIYRVYLWLREGSE